MGNQLAKVCGDHRLFIDASLGTEDRSPEQELLVCIQGSDRTNALPIKPCRTPTGLHHDPSTAHPEVDVIARQTLVGEHHLAALTPHSHARTAQDEATALRRAVASSCAVRAWEWGVRAARWCSPTSV